MTGSNGDETETLLRRAEEGDVDARSELLDRYRGQLRRMIAIRLDKRVAARADPSDIVQETMRDAYRRLPEYLAGPQLALYPWLRRIACDRLADAHRQHIGAERRTVLREQPRLLELNDESVCELAHSIVVSSIAPGQQAMQEEVQARLKAALLELKPHDREILVLRYLEQLGIAEIAQVLEISPTAVTSRHLRALQRLRLLLGKDIWA